VNPYRDLSEALTAPPPDGDEWRVHFHLPLDCEPGRGLSTTSGLLPPLVAAAGETLLEVETYTWDVLPPALRRGSVTDCIVADLRLAEGWR
jgi:hypothetical protein